MPLLRTQRAGSCASPDQVAAFQMQPMWKEALTMNLLAFLRRHLLLILFGVLIVGQLLMWRALLEIEANSSHYGSCGSVRDPCYTIAIPKAQ
jgi:hypothetical protein